jgi:hypothetical protein
VTAPLFSVAAFRRVSTKAPQDMTQHTGDTILGRTVYYRGSSGIPSLLSDDKA